MRLGLIGARLGHSFSAGYFAEKFGRLGLPHRYDLYELADVAELPALLARHPDLAGLNVTLPYKTQVLPYLAELDTLAAEAGAVNTIVRRADGTLKGYNTDVIGFGQTLDAWLAALGRPLPGRALVVGTGGAGKAVEVALRGRGIAYRVAGRRLGQDLTGQPWLPYEALPGTLGNYDLVVQTTPLGMYPDIGTAPSLPYDELAPPTLCYDLVYNPTQTHFMACCGAQGCPVHNGLPMLHAQAEAAWALWQQASGA